MIVFLSPWVVSIECVICFKQLAISHHETRQHMRHVFEVMMIKESKSKWALWIKERRENQGKELPDVDIEVGDDNDLNHRTLCDLMRKLMGVSGDLGRKVVSYL